jgi:hypothetical protein
MSRTVIFITLFTGLFFIDNAYAIAPEKHQFVTRTAMSAYKTCTSQLGVIDSLSEGIDSIAEASQLEDEFPLITRYFNWH